MANDMFTTRSGKQVPVPEIKIPQSVMTSVMRLQEDYLIRGQKYSLTGIVLEMLSKGDYTIRAHWKAAEKNKELRNTGKAVKEYIRVQCILGKPIDPKEVIRLSGMQVPSSMNEVVEDSEETLEEILAEAEELTEEQLEAATNPNGVA